MEVIPHQPKPKPVAIWSPHPLMPSHGREVVYEVLLQGESLGQYLERIGLLQRMGRQAFQVTINGCKVPRALWWRCYPRPGTLIGIYAVVRGSGSGEEGSKNTGRVIGSIIVVAIATLAFGPGGAYTSALGSGWAAVAYAGTVIIGGLIVNQMFPPPKLPRQKEEDDSPTYSISGGSNQLRRHEPFVKICGVHRVFPDFGAQPYAESEGEDAIGFYIFDFGYNDLELTDFKIGANNLDIFTGVQLQISDSTGAITLVPGNVDSVAGTELSADATPVVRTSSPDTTALAVEIVGQIFRVLKGVLQPVDCLIKIEYRAVGAGSWTGLQYVSDATPETDSGGGFITGQARVPDPGAFVFQQPTNPGEFSIVSHSRRPIRRKFYWHVPKGQYEVRVTRLSAELPPNEGVTAEIAWAQLRSYQPDTGDYTGRKRVGLKIRASGQIDGVIDQFSAIARAKAQVWTGAAFETQVTSNPAWWVLDVARGKIVNGKRVWGGNISDSRIDIEGLKLFAEWCDDEGLTFNGVFDQQVSVHEMLSSIALMGRGTLTWATGKLGVVWDAPNLPVMGVFGMHNILPGTFQIKYATEHLADVIEGEFINPDLDWQTDYVRVPVPGATGSVNVRRIPLFGRTDKTLAGQDVNLYAAQNAFRNRRYTWQSDWEAMPVSRGDVVQLSHDLSSLDYSGRFIEGGDSQTLKLPRKVPLYALGSFIVIVRPNGEFNTFSVNPGAGESDELELPSPIDPSYNPYNDADHPPYDFRWLYGAAATPGKKLKIESFKPMSERIVEISAIDEVDAFYEAKNGTFTYVPPKPVFGNAPTLTAVTITEEGVRSGVGYTVRATFDWEVTGDYGFADVRVSIGTPPANGPFQAVATEVRGRSFSILVEDNTQITVAVTAYSSIGRHGQSSTLTATKVIAFAASKPPKDVSSFTLDGPVFRWTANEEPDVTGYIIRFHYGNNLSWGDANKFHEGLLTGNAFEPPSIPAGLITFMIKAVDAAQLESDLPAAVVKELGDPTIANVLEIIDFEAAGYPGTITGGAIVSTDIEADSETSFYNVDPDVSMYGQVETDSFYQQDLFVMLTYETDEFAVSGPLTGSTATIEYTIEGVGIVIEFRNVGPDPMYGPDADPFYGLDADSFYQEPPGWQIYTGQFIVDAGVYQIRVTIGQSEVQGLIDHLVLTIDAPDLEDRLDNVVISAGGTRLPITAGKFTSIKNVQLTLQADGGSAVTAETIDKDTDLGPLVRCFNSSHVATSGLVDAIVKGY